MAYVSQSISGYNDTPPSDDGSAVSTNQVNWSFVKDKIGDPVKDLAENINTAVVNAFSQLFLGSVTDKAALFSVSATNDDGKLFNCTAAFTVTLPAAADAGDGFTVTVLNNSGGTVVIDGNSSETINGATTVSLTSDMTSYILVCNGSLWHGLFIPNNLLTSTNTFTGVNTFSATSVWSKGGDIASATTLVLGTDGNYFDVTGTTGITGITVAAGTLFMLQFDAALTLTHHATNLDLPGEADITTAAGDTLIGFATAANTVQVLSYAKATGRPVKETIVQAVNASDATMTSGTAQIPYDDTIPQNTEGLEALTLAITPTNTNNKLRIRAQVNVANAASNQIFMAALFQDSTANALHAATTHSAIPNSSVTIFFEYVMTAGTTSATTFKVRAAGEDSSTVTLNGSGAARKLGGVLAHTMTIEEIQV